MSNNFYKDVKEIEQMIKDTDNDKLKVWLFDLLSYKAKYDDSYIISNEHKPCIMCGKPTNIIEVCSEGYFCSLKCEHEFYDSLPK